MAIGTGQNILIYLAGNIVDADWTSSPLAASPTALAWGDYDDDGDLDLLVAIAGDSLLLYRNNGGGVGAVDLTPQPIWRSAERFNATSLAWADLNNDNYLDFAVGVNGGVNRIYTNRLIDNIGATEIFAPLLSWQPTIQNDATRAVAWADYDGDGNPDLTVGNYGEANLIYKNISTPGNLALSSSPVWQSTTLSKTTSLAWATPARRISSTSTGGGSSSGCGVRQSGRVPPAWPGVMSITTAISIWRSARWAMGAMASISTRSSRLPTCKTTTPPACRCPTIHAI
jgi:hypothetical protein